jgi:phosphate transport system substrate-binding protein
MYSCFIAKSQPLPSPKGETRAGLGFPFRGRKGSAVIILLLLLASCAQKRTSDNTNIGAEKIYKGRFTLDVDPGLEHVMKLQQEVFEYAHDSVKLNIQYKNEAEMLADFKSRKASVLIMARALDSLEKVSMAKHDTLYVREIKIASDAVALIGNKEFDDKALDIESLKKYFDPSNTATNVPEMVFEDQHSSVVTFVLNKLGYKEKVSGHVYALKSTEEVIDYVGKNKTAIGFIPFNFLSDVEDEHVKKLNDSIKILSLRAKDKEGKEIRVSANQSDVATGDYPLTRNIYTEMRFSYEDNLEWLFVNFLFKDQGEKIFLKDGLIPARMPARDVDINTDGLKGVN